MYVRMGFFMVLLRVFQYYFFTFTPSRPKSHRDEINSKIKHG